MTEYSLNNAELYYRNKEKDPADTQQELAEEFGCSRSTIGSRVRDFEDRLQKEDPAAKEELCDYMTELYIGVEFEDGETFSEELEGRTDADPEEYQETTEEDIEEYMSGKEILIPVRPESPERQPWYKRLLAWVERVFF